MLEATMKAGVTHQTVLQRLKRDELKAVVVTCGRCLSDNFYWRGKQVWKYQNLSTMGKVRLKGTVKSRQRGDACKLTVRVGSSNQAIALMTRLKLVDPATGLLVAPVYSDNYFALTPGESRLIGIKFRAAKVVGKEVKVMIEGWNVLPGELDRVRIERPR